MFSGSWGGPLGLGGGYGLWGLGPIKFYFSEILHEKFGNLKSRGLYPCVIPQHILPQPFMKTLAMIFRHCMPLGNIHPRLLDSITLGNINPRLVIWMEALGDINHRFL